MGSGLGPDYVISSTLTTRPWYQFFKNRWEGFEEDHGVFSLVMVWVPEGGAYRIPSYVISQEVIQSIGWAEPERRIIVNILVNDRLKFSSNKDPSRRVPCTPQHRHYVNGREYWEYWEHL